MEKKELQIADAVEPTRAWKSPILREEDYSLTESDISAVGTDMGFYS